MGYNTGILLLNDAIGEIKDNPVEFSDNLLNAVVNFRGRPFDFAIGNISNCGTIFHNSHANGHAVYAIGGNYASCLLPTIHRGNSGHHEHDEKVKLLKKIADELGYTVRKK